MVGKDSHPSASPIYCEVSATVPSDLIMWATIIQYCTSYSLVKACYPPYQPLTDNVELCSETERMHIFSPWSLISAVQLIIIAHHAGLISDSSVSLVSWSFEIFEPTCCSLPNSNTNLWRLAHPPTLLPSLWSSEILKLRNLHLTSSS